MKKEIYLAGGCFWGTQKFFDQFAGVLETEVGYANGPSENPGYPDVCAGSGHAETVRIVYDDAVISLSQLLEYYFLTIDPLSYHRQGMDQGIQYRENFWPAEEYHQKYLDKNPGGYCHIPGRLLNLRKREEGNG